ncbi:MAG: transcriptional regulator [Gammaproteobacteria bacterium RIFCSPHIGHO2_12_FULL_38_11]|nr:MAG: transcriptional regulator [Gammaproteobacteria bacterium RIFCSPHIGHO2_12_FULL_38_11]
MPILSVFYGIVIRMFWDDHSPPHFHAQYAEYEVIINIQTLETMRGKMPKRALSLLLEWASEHRVELLEDWHLCEKKQPVKKIEPLK